MPFHLVEPDVKAMLAARVRICRVTHGWTLKEMGAQTGLNPSTIAGIELCIRGTSIKTLCKLADALDVSTDYLLGRTDRPSMAGKESDAKPA